MSSGDNSITGTDRKIIFGVAGVALLIGVWLIYVGIGIFSDNQLAGSLNVAKAQTAERVSAAVIGSVNKLNDQADNEEIISLWQQNREVEAEALLRSQWPTALEAHIYSTDLEQAFEEPAKFGYGKLSVLQSALNINKSNAAFALINGKTTLVVASPLSRDGWVHGLLFVALPVTEFQNTIANNTPSGAYLAIRQSSTSLFEGGDTSLAKLSEYGYIAIEGTKIRVVGTSPMATSGLFDLGGMGELVLGGLLALLAIGFVVAPRKFAKVAEKMAKKSDADSEGSDDAPTLAELKEGGLAAPEEEVKKPILVKKIETDLPLDRVIFRAYDIRGVVGKTLDESIAKLLGQAIGSIMRDKGMRSIVVGRDGRLSSPAMATALISGLRAAGRDVYDIGMAPTPLVYFGAFQLRSGCCVSVTGSHNPPDYNGFKIVIDGETLSGDSITQIYDRIAGGSLHFSDTPGNVDKRDISQEYMDRISSDIQLERRLRVVIDAGSGVAGAIAPQLLESIGAEVECIFCEVDGNFPHHHPDPGDPENLKDLIDAVQRVDADLGIAFDGDGDRLGVVTKTGEIIYPDRLLMLFAADVLERNPGACIIYDVKCTGHLAGHILRHGGSPLMWKTGHSLIKAKMKETEAELAGEMSGHFFFRERWFGFDDGLYAACRLLELLASSMDTPEQVFDELPKGVSTPELKVQMAEGEPHDFVETFVAQANFEGARVSQIDGLRADWPDGWGLVRASNTTPTLVLRFDGNSEEALQRIQEVFREQILAISPELKLPF